VSHPDWQPPKPPVSPFDSASLGSVYSGPYPVAAANPPPYPARDPYTPPGYGYPYPNPASPVPGGWGRSAARSVSGLARAAQILLAVQLVAGLYSMVVILHQRSIAQQVISSPGTVSLEAARSADRAVTAMNTVTLVLLLISGVMFVCWFSRARRNVEAWGPRFQRHSSGWAIGAWICPIVNLWYPFQIADDILNDSESRPTRETAPLLRTWWATYLISNLMLFGASRVSADTLNALSNRDIVAVIALLVRTVALALAILVVGRITSAQTRRMTAY
jgi:hypothetical protein